jgi:hypothetical protein
MLMIERRLGYNNRRMWQHCELLQSIVEQKVMTKVGRGKNAVNIEVYKYKNNDDVIKKISESIDYYRIETMRENKLTFRDYQKEIILKGTEMLLQNKFLYLAMEVRTGKTLTSLAIAEKVNVNNVLFVTKKKAISSIESDYALFGPNYNICIINYESLHLVKDDQQWDLIVLDEAHSMGAFPKPSQRALISEHVMYVELKDSTYKIINKLKKDLVVEGKEEVILADTAVKLMMKLHQLYSGTIKFESGNSMVLDLTKAEFIKSQFATAKIGIFYKFKEELNALIQVFGAENLTTDLSVFESTDKNIALQIVSGREGISLKQADCLVYYNIDFSATSYWQSKDRMTTKDRLDNDVYWIFTKEVVLKTIYIKQ